MQCGGDLVAERVHTIDKQVEGSRTALSIGIAVIQESPNTLSHSCPFHGHTVQQDMAGGKHSRSTEKAPAGWAVDQPSMTRSWGLVAQRDLVHDPHRQHLERML